MTTEEATVAFINSLIRVGLMQSEDDIGDVAFKTEWCKDLARRALSPLDTLTNPDWRNGITISIPLVDVPSIMQAENGYEEEGILSEEEESIIDRVMREEREKLKRKNDFNDIGQPF